LAALDLQREIGQGLDALAGRSSVGLTDPL
jgi:hypothetical protein